MMRLFLYVYDILGQVREKIEVKENIKSVAINKLNEMNEKAEKEHTLYGVTLKDENGVDRWQEMVRG